MLNMKKGLALVLAAATVFTFAPVSSLGLTGVVEAQAAVTAAEFKNVDDTIYMRDVVDNSVEIKPSYVIANSVSKDGTQLYYQVLNKVPDSETLAQKDFKTEDSTTFTSDGFKVNAGKGSVKITRTAELKDTTIYLAAYELASDSNSFNLVGYKQISLKKYTNAPFALKLDQSAYTMTLNTVGSTDALDKSVKVSKTDGTYMTSTEQEEFLKDATWTVSGADIAQESKEVTEKTITDKIAAKNYGDNIYAVYSQNTRKFYANAAGSTKATVTIVSKAGTVAQTTVSLTVIGTSQYSLSATVDGSATAAVIGKPNTADNGSENPVVLDTKVNNTYNLASHIYKSAAMDISYESSNAKNTVDATTGVVKATAAVDFFYVTVTGKVNGNIVAQTKVYFKVNALPFDTVTVSGVDKDQATTLNQLDFDAVTANVKKAAVSDGNTTGRAYGVPSEQQLAASQIKYVQIEVTGTEPKQVTENLNIVSTGGAVVSASLLTQSTDNAVADVTSAGVVTLNSKVTSGVAVIKLVSAPSANTVLTTSYIYVVVDKADAKVTAPSAFKIGTCSAGGDTYNLNGTAVDHESKIELGNYAGVTRVQPLNEKDDLLSTQTLYTNATDINKNFVQTYDATDTRALNSKAKTVYVATAEGKTEKLLVTYNTGNGNTYQIVSITSVPGVTNSITKIENASTGKVIYSSDMGTVIPQIIIDGVTTLKVTIAYPIDKNNTTADIDSNNMYQSGNGLNQSIMTATKETVKKGDTANTFYLYPTTNGTQVVWFTPSGDISETDHSIVHDASQKLAVTYRTSAKPSKVTNVQVKNKKGAKVSVTFDEATNHNMKYWVQKKIGKKVAGKSIASNKTTLSVKKGATVKVRVKAYYYDAEGNKHVGAYSAWKTLKTDKK
jgi:hypothetical protein